MIQGPNQSGLCSLADLASQITAPLRMHQEITMKGFAVWGTPTFVGAKCHKEIVVLPRDRY